MPNQSIANFFDYDRQALVLFFQQLGEKSFRATQLLQWIHQRGVTDFAAMTDISKTLRSRLENLASLPLPQVAAYEKSRDGTRKWLLQLDPHNCVETVFIPDEGRNTLCISSQVGCILHCSFCATARQGFNRNLTTGEIISQLWYAEHALRAQPPPGLIREEEGRIVSNVVFMGMGEPLLNVDNVIKAIHVIMDDFSYGLSWRRVTVSTAGVVPAIDRLRQQAPVALAVSLHATRDDLRNELVPINRKYPLSELLAACKRYVQGEPRRKVTFEYVLLHGINDTVADAKQLVRLLRAIPAKVNLIPFNPFPGAPYRCSDLATIERFREVLVQAGIVTITRKTRGEDIAAACGQLAGKVRDKTHRQAKYKSIMSAYEGSIL